MKTNRQLLAAAALCALGVAPAMAQTTTLTNGDFNGGTLAGWTAEGDVSIQGSRKAVALTTASMDFDDDAPLEAGFNNHSGIAAVDFSFASDLAGVDFSALDAVSGSFASEGSAIRQDFYTLAGDTLTVTFDWTFLSAEREVDGIPAQPDFGFVAVNGTVVKFIDALSAPAVSTYNGTFGDLNDVTWGWTNDTITYTAASSGLVSLVLGVVDVGGYGLTSELRVDNIAVSAVPEPESYAMLLAGLGLMGGVAFRRRKG